MMDNFESKSIKKRTLANSDIKSAIGDAKQLDSVTSTSSMYRLSSEQMACVSGGKTASGVLVSAIAGMMPAVKAPVVLIASIAGMMPAISVKPIAAVKPRVAGVPIVRKSVK